jgi:hypothetical protein
VAGTTLVEWPLINQNATRISSAIEKGIYHLPSITSTPLFYLAAIIRNLSSCGRCRKGNTEGGGGREWYLNEVWKWRRARFSIVSIVLGPASVSGIGSKERRIFVLMFVLLGFIFDAVRQISIQFGVPNITVGAVGWIYLRVLLIRPPLWSGGQSSWLQILISVFDSLLYQIFCEVLGLERGPLSLVSTTEELLSRSSGSSLENREYCHRIRHADHVAPSIRKSWHWLRWQAAVSRWV